MKNFKSLIFVFLIVAIFSFFLFIWEITIKLQQPITDATIKHYNLTYLMSNSYVIPALYVISTLVIALTFIYQLEFNRGQLKEMSLAKFDTMYFELFKNYNLTVEYVEKRTLILSKKALSFEYLYDEFKMNYRMKNKVTDVNQRIISAYKEFIKTFPSSLPLYLKSLQDVLKYIYDNKDLLQDKKQMYYSLIVNRLNNSQKLIVFYFTIAEEELLNAENIKLKYLLEDTTIFNFVDKSMLVRQEHLEYFEK